MLVCLDRSDTAECSLRLAATLCRAENAALTLLHVLDEPDTLLDAPTTDALLWDLRRAEARAYLERLAAGISRETRAECRVAEGPAPERVAELAAELDAGLLVLGTSTASAGERTLGATGRRILELAPCPVLTVPGGGDRTAVGSVPRRILVPLDGSVRGLHVLPTVTRFARSLDAEIVLVTIVHRPGRMELLARSGNLGLGGGLAARLARQAEGYLDRVHSQLETSGLRTSRVRRVVDHGSELVELAREEGVGLTVLSARGSEHRLDRRYGDAASYFMRHSDCPLLVLQDPPRTAKRATRWASARPSSWSTDAFAGGD